MNPSQGGALLAALNGAVPPAPAWFRDALAVPFETATHEVAGARIETLSWGERGKPGLLLMHGNGAHARWWSFIAPLLARTHRVTAFSWSGMGGSDWRPSYSLDLYVEEAFTVARAEGLFDAPVAPVFVGHSFGGFPTMACAARHGDRLRAIVVADTPLRPPAQTRAREAARQRADPRPPRPYASLEEALMRFRFIPVQPCEHLFIVDHIARTSLKRVPAGADAAEHWTWRFDPHLWRDYRRGDPSADLAGARCPVALVWGSRSTRVTPEIRDYLARTAPPGTPLVELPDADHHLMVDQPLAFTAALSALLAGWP